MSIRTKVFKNMYQDSVSLMQISAHISKLAGIEQASVVMGTSTNLAQLRDAALDDGCTAGPNDLVIAVRGEIAACDGALVIAEERLNSKPEESSGDGVRPPPLASLEMAVEQQAASNLALISVPGDYAAAEAIKALRLGLSVMLFSDNVSLAHERAIKTLAAERCAWGCRSCSSKPAGDGTRLRDGHHQRHAAGLRQCGQAREDRRGGGIGHRRK
jgi:FdrA protein